MRRLAWLAPVGAVLAIGMNPAPSRAQDARVPDGEMAVELEPVPTYSLERAVGIALRNNRDLRLAELDLETAEKRVGEAYGGLLPEIDGSASVQRNLQIQEAFLPAVIFNPNAGPDDLVPVRFGADNQWQARIDVTQPLFDAAVLIGVSTAGRFRAFSREALRGAAQRTVTGVRVAYLNVLLAGEVVRLTRNSVERVEQTLEEARALNRVGLLGDYDVLRLEVELSNVQPTLRRSRNALAEARRVLGIEMGLPEVEQVGAEGSLAELDPGVPENNSDANRSLLAFGGAPTAGPIDVERLVDRATEGRSDLRQLALQRELEEARVKVERTELFPTVNAFLNYGITAQENGGLSFFGENEMQRTTSAAVGVRVTVPIFSGFRRWNRVGQRQIAVRQVESRIADLRQRAENSVRVAADAAGEARARSESQGEAVGEARRGFEIASLQYREGTGSRLEVTDAELALRQAEVNYAQAVYDYLTALARLDLAVGEVPGVDAWLGEAGE